MDALITWDFSHGSKVAQQVRWRFHSSVHHDGGSPSPEFFLLATFSEAVFDLSEENVALALESCTGGRSDKLKVLQLHAHRFRFSVASNRVGHFIHSLKFFKCPDFTCHFNLFHGKDSSPVSDRISFMDVGFSSDKGRSRNIPFYLRNVPVHLKGNVSGNSPRKSVAIKADLSILQANARDSLQKNVSISSKDSVFSSFDGIQFGQFSFSALVTASEPRSMPLVFQTGKSTLRLSLTDFSLEMIQDFIQAGYSPSDVIWYVKQYKNSCENCIALGHSKESCPFSIRCLGCLQMGHMKKNCASNKPIYEITPESPKNLNSSVLADKVPVSFPCRVKQIWVPKDNLTFCPRCLTVGHSSLICKATPRCQSCAKYGHSITGCSTAKNHMRKVWRIKTSTAISSDLCTEILPYSVSSPGSAPSTSPLPSLMANFSCNPYAFVPTGFAIDHGPDNRRVRCDLALSAVSPLNHDNYAVAETNHEVQIQQRFHARRELRRMLNHDGFQVSHWEDYPIGLGMFAFANSFVRDAVVGRTYMIDEGLEATFVKHDEALNRRSASLGEERWLMLLAFPMDYQTDYWVEKVVSLFGKLLIWQNPSTSHARMLVKAWVMNDALVPKSIIMRQMGGLRNCWTVPVYLLRPEQWTAHMHNVPVDSEEPPPADGNPHPIYGPHVTAEMRFQQRLQIWLQQNGIIQQRPGGNQNAANMQHDIVIPAASLPPMHFPSRGQFNYQAVLRDQGRLFSDGVLPANNITDSPLSAWNDMVSEGSSQAAEFGFEAATGPTRDLNITETENFIPLNDSPSSSAIVPYNDIDDSEVIPPVLMIARSVLISMQQPSIYMGTKQPVNFPWSLVKFNQAESTFVPSSDSANVISRRVARKLYFESTPAMESAIVLLDDFVSADANDVPEDFTDLTIEHAVVHQVRNRRKRETPKVSTAVRRSPRNHAVAGYKVQMPTDSKKKKSKVKPRVIPGSNPVVSAVAGKGKEPVSGDATSPIPPPTPVQVLQKIGVNICGIPAEELEKEKLEQEKDLQEEYKGSSSGDDTD